MIRKWSVILYILLLSAALIGVLYGAYRYFFGGIQTDDAVRNAMNQQQAVGSAGVDESGEHDCVALFGIDTQQGDAGRSDAILLAAIDRDDNTVRLCSIARDTRVEVEGHGTCKLNAAYAYGGGELAVRTIRQSFGVEVSDYVAVNFSGMADIIDRLGGVDVELSAGELDYLGDLGDGLEAGSRVHLDGAQAVAYSRIRHLDSDDVRTSRQREVLGGLLDEVRQMDSEQYPQLLDALMAECTTNLTQSECMALFARLMPEDARVEQYAIPSEQTNARGGLIDGVWYYTYDLAAAGEEMRAFFGA